ncbi:MAG: DNA repair protein RecO [Bacillota bacterium]|nr:DNA repair protein RecO [Bacillota bacterium]
MRYYSADAIVIKAMDYSESHRIFTFYSRDEGKLSAIARGVKKQKSKLKGYLQLGNRCNLLLYRGRSLDIVSQATSVASYPHIRENPKAYLYSSYLLELLDSSVPEREPNPSLFDLTHEVLGAMAELEPVLAVRYFEIHLLRLLGYDADFRCCVYCGKPLKEGFLSPRFEGVVGEECGSGYPVSPQALYALQYYRQTPLERIGRLKVNAETEKMMARVTRHMLDFHLERKLRSLDVLRDLT